MVALLLLGTIPYDDMLAEYVDVVELNHFYDDRGRLVIEQVIFWEWNQDKCRLQVRAFRVVKCKAMLPKPLVGGGCVCRWKDNGVYREVTGGSFRESWTQDDPEIADRDNLPKERRRQLRPLCR